MTSSHERHRLIAKRLDAATKVATVALATATKYGSLLLAFSIIGGLVLPRVAHELCSVVPIAEWTRFAIQR